MNSHQDRDAARGAVDMTDVATGGSGGAQVRDPRGVVLSQTSFDSRFFAEALTENGYDLIPMAEVPVSFFLPNEGLPEFIDIVANGNRLPVIHPHASLLESAIRNVPDAALVGDKGEARAVLEHKAKVVGDILRSQNYFSGRTLIRSSLRPAIIELVSASYQKGDTSEYDRADVLAIVDSVLQAAGSLGTVVQIPNNAVLSVRPEQETYSPGQRANIRLNARTKSSNSEKMLLAELTLNGKPQKVVEVSLKSWKATTERLVPGLTTIAAKLFIADKRLYAAAKASIERVEVEILQLDRQLEVETDPEVRAEIFSKIHVRQMIKDRLASKIRENMSQVGSVAEVLLNVE